MTRVLHAGNVANNAYLNAKLQRRAGIEADALCDERHILSLPEWEDAPLSGTYEEYAPLEEIAGGLGWTRPPWVLKPDDPRRRRRFKGQHLFAARLQAYALTPFRTPGRRRTFRRDYEPLREILGHGVGATDLGRAQVALYMFGLPWRGTAGLFGRYDVIQAYATYPIYLYIAAPERSYVAFEHGTMREIPFEDSYRGRLLAVAYRRAAKVIITNPDVIGSARRLGLKNYVFIPHPVDEDKYTPGDSRFRSRVGASDTDLVLLSPSRHDWDIKGNDRMIRGFAELVRSSRRRALLVLTEWGGEVDRTRRLAAELGCAEHVRWIQPLPKLELIDAYRGADVVLDQFLIGTFGAVAPEAMACGRPVVMAFEPEVHRWCFGELPPIVPAREPEEIAGALLRLAERREERERIGAAGRAWIEREHGWRLVVERHRAVYEEVLAAEQDRRRRAELRA